MKIIEASEKHTKQIMRMQEELFRKWDSMDEIDKVEESWFGSAEHEEEVVSCVKNHHPESSGMYSQSN